MRRGGVWQGFVGDYLVEIWCNQRVIGGDCSARFPQDNGKQIVAGFWGRGCLAGIQQGLFGVDLA